MTRTLLLACALLVAQAPPLPAQPSPPKPPSSDVSHWPKSCQRFHYETNRCQNGRCNERRLRYWRKRCERDEPHGQ